MAYTYQIRHLYRHHHPNLLYSHQPFYSNKWTKLQQLHKSLYSYLQQNQSPIPEPNFFFLLPLTICYLVWSSTINVHLLNSIRIFLCCGWVVPPLFSLFGWVSPCLRSKLELNDQESIVCDSTNSPVAADKATLAHSAKIVFKSTIYERLLEFPLKTGLWTH